MRLLILGATVSTIGYIFETVMKRWQFARYLFGYMILLFITGFIAWGGLLDL